MKRFSNQGMKVHVKRAFQTYSFFVTEKNNKKALHEISSAPNTSVQQMSKSPVSKSRNYLFSTLLRCPHFFEEYLNPPSQDQQNGKELSVDYHPNPSGLTSSIHPLIFL